MQPVHSWDEWRQRVLSPDRRVFYLTHSHTHNEPLALLQVALINGFSTACNVSPLLRRSDNPSWLSTHASDVDNSSSVKHTYDTAVFYSVGVTYPALAGLRRQSIAARLIQMARNVLHRGFPELTVFTTLSPVQRFRSWLVHAVQMQLERSSSSVSGADAGVTADSLLLPAEEKALRAYSFSRQAKDSTPLHTFARLLHLTEVKGLPPPAASTEPAYEQVKTALTVGQSADVLRPICMRLMAEYLVFGQRKGPLASLEHR